jgi:hypothetical protein
MSGSGPILSLDPSSTCCGYAVLAADGRLIEAGVVTPVDKAAGSWSRVMEICEDVEALCNRWDPSVVLIEWTKGKVGRRHHGYGAGLAVYGAGVGAVGRQVWLWAARRVDVTVEAVAENTWTRGVPKADRAMAIDQEYPQLAGADDPGLDLHDAVGLAVWWRRQQLVR